MIPRALQKRVDRIHTLQQEWLAASREPTVGAAQQHLELSAEMLLLLCSGSPDHASSVALQLPPGSLRGVDAEILERSRVAANPASFARGMGLLNV